LVPYGYFERSLLHPVHLAPLPRKRRWLLLLAGLPILAALGVAFAMEPGAAPAITRLSSLSSSGAQRASAAALLPKGVSVPFEVCYYNSNWAPPDADLQAQHLQGDARYRGLDIAQQPLAGERVHVELGPYRSTSAFTDFVQLSGLWTDPNATSSACPADLEGKAELWTLQLRIQRFELTGADFVAYADQQPAGVEVTQVALPPAAQALHVLDAGGAKLAPDVSLRAG